MEGSCSLNRRFGWIGPGPAGLRGRGASGVQEMRPAPGRTLDAIFPEPLAAKVPEITFLFWVIKILTTCGGEAVSDYLAQGNRRGGAVVEMGLRPIALVGHSRPRRYTAAAYWFLAYAIAIFGTGVSDTLHLTFGLPYAATTILWAVVLAAVFWTWHRSEGTLSIHSITTQRRGCFYWVTVFATFALGTALGDLTAVTFKLGYLGSVFLFAVVIAIPAVAWWGFRMNATLAFWFAYVVTRPLGASVADYLSKPTSTSGAGFGDARIAIVMTIAVALGVCYLTITRSDIQQPTTPARSPAHHG